MVGESVRASVIIPAYNGEAFIEKSLRSALRQTERNIEFVVVDDCSTDRTLELVSAIGKEDSRVRAIPLDRNEGHAHAQNIGISHARGEWIALLDQDDWFGPSRLEDSTLR